MPGTLLLDDWRSSVEDQLKQHAQGLGQAFQVIGNAAPQVQAPDPTAVFQELQSHAQQAAEQAQQGITQFAQQRQQQVADVGQQLQDYAQSLGGTSGVTQFQQPAPAQQDVTSFVGPPPTQQASTPAGGETTAPQHEPSPPLQTDGTQIANTPSASGQVFPLTVKPDNAPSATYHSQGGSDLMAPRGTPVLNMQSGRVDEVFTDNGSHTVGGNAVLVHGDDGLDYYYAHFDQPPGVKVGQRVGAGEQIGAVGNSGNAWKGGEGATHLHIGIGKGISNGVGSEGGLGQNFNAQALLTDLQSGIGQASSTARGAVQTAGNAAGQAVQNVVTKVGQGQQDFINTLQPMAQDVAARTGIDPNAMLAIAANETGWGHSQTAQQQNNLFSIQGDGSNGSRWASYASPAQAFDAFVNLISSAPRYAQAWADRADPGKFVDDLRHAGYVVDEPGFPAQGWVDQVKSIYGSLPPATAGAGTDLGGASPQRQAAVATLGGTRPTAREPLYAGVKQPAGDAERTPFQVIGDVAGQLGAAARGALPPEGQSPHPLPGQPGGLVTPPGTYNPAPGSLGGAVGRTIEDVGTQARQVVERVPEALGGSAQAAGGAVQDFAAGAQQAVAQVPTAQELGRNIAGLGAQVPEGIPLVSGAATGALGIVGGLIAQPGVLDSMATVQRLNAKYATSAGATSIPDRAGGPPLVLYVDPSVMSEEDRAAYTNAMVVVGSMSGPQEVRRPLEGVRPVEGAPVAPPGVPEPVTNPYELPTAPAHPTAAPLSGDEVLSHLEYLDQLHTQNDARIAELQNRLAAGGLGRGETSGTVVRPPWAAGWTNAGLEEVARRNDLNPYEPLWWERGNLVLGTGEMRENVGQSGVAGGPGYRGTKLTQQTPTEMRAELARLQAEQTHLETAQESIWGHVDQGGDVYGQPSVEALPFDRGGPDAGATQAGAGPARTTAAAARGGGEAPSGIPDARTSPELAAPIPAAVTQPELTTRTRPAIDDLYDTFRQLDPNAPLPEAAAMRIGDTTVRSVEEVPGPRGALASTQGNLVLIRSDLTKQQFGEALSHEMEHVRQTGLTPLQAEQQAYATGGRALSPEAEAAAAAESARIARAGTGGTPPRPPAPPTRGPGGPTPPGGSSPELDRLNTMFDGKKPVAPSSVADRIQAVGDSLTRAFTDRQVDINRAQERYAANLGRPLRGDEMAAELQRLASDPAAQVKVDEGLKPAIQSVGEDYPSLRNYVTLRSNVEVADNLARRTGKPDVATERQFSGGLTRDESAKALQDLETQLGPERFARVQAAADQVNAFNQTLRQRLVDGGVLDATTAAQLEAQYPNWAKTRILDYMADPSGGQGAGTKLGLNDRGLREYTLAGTTKAREDPIASTVAYAHQVERMAMKNEAFNAFLKIDQAGETPMLREVPQSYTPTKNEVSMIGFVNGQKQKYVTDNKALGEAINGAGVLSTPEWTSAWQKVFRSLATSRNPVFLAGNAALDIPTYVLRQSVRAGGPQAMPRILLELARGYADAFQGLLQGEYRGAGTSAYLKGGGGQAGYFTGGEGASKQAIAEMQRKNVFQINGPSDLARLTKDILTLHPVEALGERIELGPRVAAMRLAERRGANPTQAVIDGRTVTIDFSQGGTVTKYLNNFIPFFNVGFQGPAQVARAFRENKGAFVATVGTLIGTPSVAAEVWNRSDPQRAKDYADVPQYVKDQGIVIMLPGDAEVDKQGNRKPLYAVVKLREWAPFAALAREATARAMGDDTRSVQDMAQSIGTGLSPTSSTSLVQAGTEPLAGIPILPAAAQLEMNKDFFRNRTIVSQRADENASALSKTLAPALQAVLDRAGANVEIRPSAIDFLIRNQGAGVGGAVLGAGDLAAGETSNTVGPTGEPVVGGLAGRFVGSQTGDELQQARDQTLTSTSRQILRSNGITITPGAVSGSVNQIPLKLEEETRYQQLANRYIDDAIQRTAASSDFATKTQVGKQSMIDQAMQGARAKAGNEVLNTIPADEKRRRLRTKSTAA